MENNSSKVDKNRLLFEISSNALSLEKIYKYINDNINHIHIHTHTQPLIDVHYTIIENYCSKLYKLLTNYFKVRTYYQLIKLKIINIYQLNKIVCYQKKIIMRTNCIKKYISDNIIVDKYNRRLNVSDDFL